MKFFRFTVALILTLAAPQAHACEYTVAVPDWLFGDTTLMQALQKIEESDPSNCLKAIPTNGNDSILALVASGQTDSGLLHSGYLARGSDDSSADWLLSSAMGFQFSSAGDFWSAFSDVDAYDLSNFDAKAQFAVPLGISLGMWNSDWDGTIAGADAEFSLVTPGQRDAFSIFSKSFSNPVGFRPHTLITNSSYPSEQFEDGPFRLLGDALSEILVERQIEVQRELQDKGIALINPLQDTTLTPLERLEELRTVSPDWQDWYVGLQCASGTCPCSGSNTCSKKCCNN